MENVISILFSTTKFVMLPHKSWSGNLQTTGHGIGKSQRAEPSA